jgi:hypothetical protein
MKFSIIEVHAAIQVLFPYQNIAVAQPVKEEYLPVVHIVIAKKIYLILIYPNHVLDPPLINYF